MMAREQNLAKRLFWIVLFAFLGLVMVFGGFYTIDSGE